MRGGPNTFKERWVCCSVATPAGTLTFTVFPGPVPFFGCSRLDGVPVAPAEAHRLLVEVGDEHATTHFIGDGRLQLEPRRSM